MKKTNAMRLLDSKKIEYTPFSYEDNDGKIDGISVANKMGRKVEDVYKTLVCVGDSLENYVFLIPVSEELNLKKAAKSVDEKSISMISVNDIEKLTGYIRGGCSPIGMKREFKTIISKEAKYRDKIIVSGGQIGTQVELNPKDLGEFVHLEFKGII